MVRKIGSSHVVWFPESNRWVEFQEPAWLIYQGVGKGEDDVVTTAALAKKYGLPEKEARRFYREVSRAIKESEISPAPVTANPEEESEPDEEPDRNGRLAKTPATKPDPAHPGPHPSHKLRTLRTRTRHYRANNRHFTITFGSPLAEYYIHRPLAHLETDNGSTTGPGTNKPGTNEPGTNEPGMTDPGTTGPGTPEAGALCLYLDAENKGKRCYAEVTLPGAGSPAAYHFDDPGFLKHRAYTEICNHIHGTGNGEWMCYIHASAVTDGHRAVLLPSASGSGKSTMAALLQLPADETTAPGSGPPTPHSTETGTGSQSAKNNKNADLQLWFMSDDFIPVSASNLKAYPFPAAIAVKEGSYDVVAPWYDQRSDADAGYRVPGRKPVRYLRPRFPGRDPFGPRPVTAMVFLKYDAEANFSMEMMDTLRALEAFHREAWVSQNPAHAEKFIDWFVNVSCYRLTFSNSQQAAGAIKNLFGNR